MPALAATDFRGLPNLVHKGIESMDGMVVFGFQEGPCDLEVWSEFEGRKLNRMVSSRQVRLYIL